MTRWACEFYLTADNDLSKVIRKQAKFDGIDPKNVSVAVQLDTPSVRTERQILGKKKKLEVVARSMKRNLNAGDPQTFVNFLFALKHLLEGGCTVIIFAGHSTGVSDLAKLNQKPNGRSWRAKSRLPGAVALGIDQTSRDFLDNNELDGALRAFRDRTTGPFHKADIIGFDGCLMASVELAHQLREHAVYLVASQDNVPVAGWPYRKILKTFNDNVHPARAAMNIVEAYGKTRPDKETLSAIALEQMDTLVMALNRLGNTFRRLSKRDTSTLRKIARARNNARTFANIDSVDLYSFARELREQFKARRTVVSAATGVLHAVRDAVLATNKNPEQGNGGRKQIDAHGLSVYFPNFPVIEAYHALPLSTAAPQWHDFVVTFGQYRNQRL
jgi:hypothetical protein